MRTPIPIDRSAMRGFHEDLRVILSAGLPLCLGPTLTTPREVRQFLNALEGRVATIADDQYDDESQSVSSLIQNDSAIPVEYRGALLAWAATNGNPLAIEPLVMRSEAAKREQTHRFISAITPFVWCTVALCALALLSWTYFPAVVAFAESIEHTSPTVSLVRWLAGHLTVWVWLLPVGLGALWLLWRLTGPKSAKHRDSLFQIAQVRAAEADRAAMLAEHQLPLKPLLPQEFNLQPHEQLPPLVAWAIAEAETPGGLPVDGSLRIAGRLYRSLANLQAEALRRLTPTTQTLLVGGLLALLVALTVFLPLVDLLLGVSTEGTHQ